MYSNMLPFSSSPSYKGMDKPVDHALDMNCLHTHSHGGTRLSYNITVPICLWPSLYSSNTPHTAPWSPMSYEYTQPDPTRPTPDLSVICESCTAVPTRCSFSTHDNCSPQLSTHQLHTSFTSEHFTANKVHTADSPPVRCTGQGRLTQAQARPSAPRTPESRRRSLIRRSCPWPHIAPNPLIFHQSGPLAQR